MLEVEKGASEVRFSHLRAGAAGIRVRIIQYTVYSNMTHKINFKIGVRFSHLRAGAAGIRVRII